jgi:hypothetical protein
MRPPDAGRPAPDRPAPETLITTTVTTTATAEAIRRGLLRRDGLAISDLRFAYRGRPWRWAIWYSA